MTRSFKRSQASLLRSYLAGLTLSTAGSSSTFGIAAGVANDSTNADTMVLAAAITKTTGAFVAGSGNGALDTGAIAASTWYWTFLIENTTTGAVDVCVTKAVAATTPTPTLPSGFTLYRYIGSMKTDASSHWFPFIQFGDEFLWVTAFGDISATVTTSAALFTLTVPLGVQVNALMRGVNNTPSVGGFLLINSPDESSVAPNSPSGNTVSVNPIAGGSSGSQFVINVRTNTSGQVRAVSTSASATVNTTTYGYIDRRGRDA